MLQKLIYFSFVVCLLFTTVNGQIIHDAEQSILQEQFGEQWATQDKEIDAKLKALEKKFGKKPNGTPNGKGTSWKTR